MALSVETVRHALSQVYDPELPVNIVDLGLVYDIRVSADDHVDVTMTLTTPACGMGEMIAFAARNACIQIAGAATAHVEITFDPLWTTDRITEPDVRSRLQLD